MVNLRDNVCIVKLFHIGRSASKFRRKISRSCSSPHVKKQLKCSAVSTNCDETLDPSKSIENQNNLSCCEVESETFIDAPDYTFETNLMHATFQKLVIANQQNVEFLPVLLHENFTIVEYYSIKNTAVQKLVKKNFEKMSQIKYLKLVRNQIEVIRSDTFEDLKNLKLIWIST